MKYILLLLAMTSALAHASESIETIPLDNGNTISVVENVAGGHPKYVLILLVGSNGVINIQKAEDGSFKYYKSNFLMRAREWLVSDDIATIAPDVPSDQAKGYTDNFRNSDRHLSDMRKIIAYARLKFPQAKVFIVSTSQGSVSSGVLAVKLGNEIDGVIHTSAMNGNVPGAGLPLWRLNYSLAKSPQLFIHHRDDNCKFTRFDPIKEKAEKFNIELIEITGGKGDENRDPCQPFSNHGFYGVEETVAAKIKGWLK
ncbi:hypothetical protein J1C51_23555 [Chromobacterium haemolyticum]|uniref:hypothetical protein n=1 Tax=Chromobacterium haemolyticum TaxID=394935 RepID=UPI001A911DD6|nr:hypothetical protein [Chromobacterium haemolyticum]MBO0501754.1 hypothetical protein [Chromobacterium haemolyticum]